MTSTRLDRARPLFRVNIGWPLGLALTIAMLLVLVRPAIIRALNS